MSTLATIGSMKMECRTPPFSPHSNETIRSGQFMVSTLNDAAVLSEDDSPSPGSDCSADPSGVTNCTFLKGELPSQTLALTPGPGFDFRNACQEARNLNCQFGGSEAPPLFGIEENLSKLLECMSITYRANITNPKWNPFRGLKVSVKDKVRLNNIIWREYHMQFVKKKKPIIVQFTSALSENHANPEAIVLEGKYWKRKLEVVRQEYQACRQVLRHLSSRTRNFQSNEDGGIDISGTRRFRQRSLSHVSPAIGVGTSGGRGFSGILPNLDRLDENMDLLHSDISHHHHHHSFVSSSQLPSHGPMHSHNSPSTSMLDDLMLSAFDDFDLVFDPNSTSMWNADVIQPDLSQLQPNVDDIHNLDLFSNVFHNSSIGTASAGVTTSTASGSISHTETLHHPISTFNIESGSMVDKCIVEFMDVDSEMDHERYHHHSHNLSRNHLNTSSYTKHNPPPPSSSTTTHHPLVVTPLTSSHNRGYQSQTSRINNNQQQQQHQFQSREYGNSKNLSSLSQGLDINNQSFQKSETSVVLSTVSNNPNQLQQSKEYQVHTNHDIMPTSGSLQSSATKCSELVPLQQKSTLHRDMLRAPTNHLVAIAPKPEMQYPPFASPNVIVRPINQMYGNATDQSSTIRRSDIYTNSPYMSASSDTSASSFTVSLNSPSPTPTSSPLRRVIEEFDSYGSANVDGVSNDLDGHYGYSIGRRLPSCFNIAQGFVQLEKLLKQFQTVSGHSLSSSSRSQMPGLVSSGPKTSKATLLHKAADQIRRMKEHQRRIDHEIEQLESQINLLQGDLSHSYSQLPATGVDLNNKPSQQGQVWFQEYVLTRSSANWKFYPFSLFLKKLFFSYNVSVVSVNAQMLNHAVGAWLDQCCSMIKLRQLVTDSLREMIQHTNILTNPLSVPDEILAIIREKRKALPLSSSPTAAATSSTMNIKSIHLPSHHQVLSNNCPVATYIATPSPSAPCHQRATARPQHPSSLHVSPNTNSTFSTHRTVIALPHKNKRPTNNTSVVVRPNTEAAALPQGIISPSANSQVTRMPIFLMPTTISHGPRFDNTSCVGELNNNPSVEQAIQSSSICINSNRVLASGSSTTTFQNLGSSISGTINLNQPLHGQKGYVDVSNRSSRGGRSLGRGDGNSYGSMRF